MRMERLGIEDCDQHVAGYLWGESTRDLPARVFADLEAACPRCAVGVLVGQLFYYATEAGLSEGELLAILRMQFEQLKAAMPVLQARGINGLAVCRVRG
jgi:hypothetical protein